MADLDVLSGIGLQCVVDLRTSAELERTGRGLLGGTSVRYVHLSLLRGNAEVWNENDGQVEDMAHMYLRFLEGGRSIIPRAVSLIANPANRPLVFHCAAGKDRTGVLTALLLDALGVERAAIIDDYALTANQMDLIVTRLKRETNHEVRISAIPEVMLRAEPKTMEIFLTLLHEHFGGGRGWMLSAGVSQDALDSLSQLLVGPIEL
jgi:hypothetical protein